MGKNKARVFLKNAKYILHKSKHPISVNSVFVSYLFSYNSSIGLRYGWLDCWTVREEIPSLVKYFSSRLLLRISSGIQTRFLSNLFLTSRLLWRLAKVSLLSNHINLMENLAEYDMLISWNEFSSKMVKLTLTFVAFPAKSLGAFSIW